MELRSYFTDFLSAIRPTESQKEDYKTGHRTLRQRLNDDQKLSPILISDFLQGSYRRATAIRPVGDRRADVDVIIVTNLSEKERPADAVDRFVPFLEKHYPKKYHFQDRSVAIELSAVDIDFVITSAPSEVDLEMIKSAAVRSFDTPEDTSDWRLTKSWIPVEDRRNRLPDKVALREAAKEAEWKASPLMIPDREKKIWEPTHPLRQIQWTWEKNNKCGGHYVNVVKAIKWSHRFMRSNSKYPSHWRRATVDGLGRLVEVDEQSTATIVSPCPGTGESLWKTSYTYDTLGDLSTVVQNGSRNRNYSYDSLARATSTLTPESGTVSYTYDADDNLKTETDARGITINYAYEALNRLSGKTYSNGDPAVTYTYDETACQVVTSCYNVGHRTSMTDAAGSEKWSYSSMGYVWEQQRTIGAVTNTTGYTYDYAGNVATLTYPSGRVVTYTTDSANRYSAATDLPHSTTYITGTCPNGTANPGVCYAPQGMISAEVFGAATGSYVTQQTTYNNRLQPNTTNVFVQGGATLLNLTYSFVDPNGDNNGNVRRIVNGIQSDLSETFTYDHVNRLITAKTDATYATDSANCWGESFDHDPWGNLGSIGVFDSTYTGCQQEWLSVTPLSSNQVSATGYTYGLSGNMTSDGVYSYGYDAEGQMSSAAGLTYKYDGDGHRIQKVGSKLYWLGIDGAVLDESDSSGNLTDEFVYFGGKRVAHRDISGGTLHFYAQDMIGSSRLIFSSSGIVCYSADFYPHGGERPHVNTCNDSYKFTGNERDTESGLDYVIARHYTPSIGRFMTPDTHAGQIQNPQTLNLYAYSLNSPEIFVDPSGNDCVYFNTPSGEPEVVPGDCKGDDDPGIFVDGHITNIHFDEYHTTADVYYTSYNSSNNPYNQDQSQSSDGVADANPWAGHTMAQQVFQGPGSGMFGAVDKTAKYAAVLSMAAMGGAIAAPVLVVEAQWSAVRVAIGSWGQAPIHFAIGVEETWMHGREVMVGLEKAILMTEDGAAAFAGRAAINIPLPVLNPSAVLPPQGQAVSSCLAGACAALFRGWTQ